MALVHNEIAAAYQITSYDAQGIYVNQNRQQQSFWLTANKLTPWPVVSLTRLNPQDIISYLTQPLEILLLATNEYPEQHLSSEIQVLLYQHGLGVEIMGLAAACRTYTVLISEQRAVACGFILAST